MPPREEDQKQLVHNITVRDVEIVFESGHIDVSVELALQLAFNPKLLEI